MPGFGVLVLIFLFAAGLFGAAFAGKPVVTTYETTSLDAITYIDESQNGGTLELAPDEEVDLSLRHRATRPHVAGSAITLGRSRGGHFAPYPSTTRTDTWMIRRVHAGTATITTTSGPAFRFTVIVP